MGGLCYRGFKLPADALLTKEMSLSLTVNDSFHISLQIIFA